MNYANNARINPKMDELKRPELINTRNWHTASITNLQEICSEVTRLHEYNKSSLNENSTQIQKSGISANDYDHLYQPIRPCETNGLFSSRALVESTGNHSSNIEFLASVMFAQWTEMRSGFIWADHRTH
jgi:UDP-galactopyranose mutase